MKTYVSKETVIEVLKNGGHIYSRHNEHFGLKGQTVYYSRTYSLCDETDTTVGNIHHSTIYALQNKNIIGDKYKYIS